LTVHRRSFSSRLCSEQIFIVSAWHRSALHDPGGVSQELNPFPVRSEKRPFFETRPCDCTARTFAEARRASGITSPGRKRESLSCFLHSDSLIRKLVSQIDEQDWQQVEIIGWHQFYAVAKKRKVLEDRIKRLGSDWSKAFGQTMEALAYTWFNRLVAIRFMELHGYLEHGYRVLSQPEGKPTPEILEEFERRSELVTANVMTKAEGEMRLDNFVTWPHW
jgi:hypothetical protein